MDATTLLSELYTRAVARDDAHAHLHAVCIKRKIDLLHSPSVLPDEFATYRAAQIYYSLAVLRARQYLETSPVVISSQPQTA